MRLKAFVVAVCGLAGMAAPAFAQNPAAPAAAQPATQPPAPPDPIKAMVDRLDLERYKATIKGLTQFGDRRQGTDRNRAAIDWIEAQLKSYGCTNTERLTYTYPSPAASDPDAPGRGSGAGRGRGAGEATAVSSETRRAREGGSSQFGTRSRTASTARMRRARRHSIRGSVS